MPTDKVFLDYTQEQLDRAYDQLVWAPHRDQIQAEIRKDCEAVRQKMPPRSVRYGKSEKQVLDIYAPPDAARAPVLVYLHGGAWLRGSHLDVCYPAPALMARGAALVVPEFDNVATVPLPAMIQQCREAVDWTVRNAASFGGDPERIYLAGHSSGAHLASCVLLGDLPINGALLISGMYDLHAPLLSARSQYVKITPEELDAASARRHLGRIRCPVAVAWSTGDSPEFRRQGHVLAMALEGMGRLASRTEVFSANHFEEPRQLADPDSPLGRVLFALMKL
ncbi:MAG TPA: alpha/beta hydrolase [Reyranella sp.]|nr:alpha/beta hydrolase [Reyranella sp.]